MRATIIVGSGYGDEGKGLCTDWVCSEELKAGRRPLVVRANGGTQAAHTVVTPEGMGHVFHTHGSGSLLDVPTYLSRHFIFNPVGFRMEQQELPQLTLAEIYVSPDMLVSLPVDMMINQLVEQTRGGDKHGSCGWGIGETVERSLSSGWRITFGELAAFDAATVAAISDEYLEYRLRKLGVERYSLSQEWQNTLGENAIIHHFMADCAYALARTMQIREDRLPVIADSLIFEGAQGLGLDQDSEHFPHVTRSSTGSRNPLEVMQECGAQQWEAVEPLYVIRSYATRHGAGPLEHEGEAHGCNVVDPTNVPNQWQDSLRTAPLDLALVSDRVARDFQEVLRNHPLARLNMLMTCMDQATGDYSCVAPESPPSIKNTPATALGRIGASVKTKCLGAGYDSKGMRFLGCWGRTRTHVRVLAETELLFSEHVAQIKKQRVRAGGG